MHTPYQNEIYPLAQTKTNSRASRPGFDRAPRHALGLRVPTLPTPPVALNGGAIRAFKGLFLEVPQTPEASQNEIPRVSHSGTGMVFAPKELARELQVKNKNPGNGEEWSGVIQKLYKADFFIYSQP